ncbi:MBL fold metallo-hydrolase [Paenibacillus sp. MAHUQ-46]|uniref:MBL fold metallo-hydrolase n=2 Tax=Paenibacillus TaxID=44249 RepID=A0A934J6V2_9BACL|nr:MBL fold metallo-hydrolase [Paenibacillus roseus]MBJ6363990.1 MBL fold metallo-hydrolase [Paenibacillus roseus]
MVLVSDPCWLPHEVERIRCYAIDKAGDRPLYILFTHSDFDHIIGCGAFPEAQVIASYALADKNDEQREQILEKIHTFDDDYYVTRDYPIIYPEVSYPVSEEGQQLKIGNTTLTFYHAQGHNDDGIFTIVEPLGVWLAGDYLSDLEFPYIYHSSKRYEETIAKVSSILARHSISMLVPGHGQFTEDIEEIRRRQDKDEHYIHSLRSAIVAGDEQRMAALIQGCPYPRNMQQFHRNNQLLIERELHSN